MNFNSITFVCEEERPTCLGFRYVGLNYFRKIDVMPTLDVLSFK